MMHLFILIAAVVLFFSVADLAEDSPPAGSGVAETEEFSPTSEVGEKIACSLASSRLSTWILKKRKRKQRRSGDCNVKHLRDIRYQIDASFTVRGYTTPVSYTAIAKISKLEKKDVGKRFPWSPEKSVITSIDLRIMEIKLHGISDDFISTEAFRRFLRRRPSCSDQRRRSIIGFIDCYPSRFAA